MEKIIIQYEPDVEQRLDDLVYILFKEEYFSYEESSLEYVLKIIAAVKSNINDQRQHKRTPVALVRYGEWYISYKTTKRTAWYVFFSRKENMFLVKHITNNHVADAAFLKHFNSL